MKFGIHIWIFIRILEMCLVGHKGLNDQYIARDIKSPRVIPLSLTDLNRLDLPDIDGD